MSEKKPFWHWIEEACNAFPILKGKPLAILEDGTKCYLEIWTGEGDD